MTRYCVRIPDAPAGFQAMGLLFSIFVDVIFITVRPDYFNCSCSFGFRLLMSTKGFRSIYGNPSFTHRHDVCAFQSTLLTRKCCSTNVMPLSTTWYGRFNRSSLCCTQDNDCSRKDNWYICRVVVNYFNSCILDDICPTEIELRNFGAGSTALSQLGIRHFSP